jgi:hypothetical protein
MEETNRSGEKPLIYSIQHEQRMKKMFSSDAATHAGSS